MAVNFQFLRLIREKELSQVLPWIPSGSRILEIGAGAGWQARQLAATGHVVTAIDMDVEGLGYRAQRVWPVMPYDGIHIPCANHHFDVVFSSNVMEHIAHFDSFQAEIKRVLRPGGVAIHVVPTGAWRFWTNVTYYLDLFTRMLLAWQGTMANGDQASCQGSDSLVEAVPSVPTQSSRASGASPDPPLGVNPGMPGSVAGSLAKAARLAYPRRHGEQGSALSEIYGFSRWGWDRRFWRTGWETAACFPNHLFYTGYFILGPRVGLCTRGILSYFLGSACLIYVLRAGAGTRAQGV